MITSGCLHYCLYYNGAIRGYIHQCAVTSVCTSVMGVVLGMPTRTLTLKCVDKHTIHAMTATVEIPAKVTAQS